MRTRPCSGLLSGKSSPSRADSGRQGEGGKRGVRPDEESDVYRLYEPGEVGHVAGEDVDENPRQVKDAHGLTCIVYRNEYLNSKPGRETEAAQEMDSVTS